MATNAPVDPELVRNFMFYGTIRVGFIALGGTIIGAVAFWKTDRGAARIFSFLVQRADATRLVAVLAIVMAAFALAIIGKIESGAVVSILSGVAGFSAAWRGTSSGVPTQTGRVRRATAPQPRTAVHSG